MALVCSIELPSITPTVKSMLLLVQHIECMCFAGVAAMAGARIPGEVYAWVVVFLLPVNSAINPVLYTISSIRLMKVNNIWEAMPVSWTFCNTKPWAHPGAGVQGVRAPPPLLAYDVGFLTFSQKLGILIPPFYL